MKVDIKKLRTFLINSTGHTYAGDGKKISPQRPGYIEMEYKEGDWYLRDSYVGHYQAPGMTTVYFKNKPVWTCAYGGQVFKKYHSKSKEIFSFLKKAMKRKDLKKPKDIIVRGPALYEEPPWKYTFDFEGNMECFYGREKIFLNGKLVFYQDVIGGLVLGRD